MDENNLKTNLENLSKEINMREKSELEVADPHLNSGIGSISSTTRNRKKKFIVYSGAIIFGLIISFFISYSIFQETESPEDNNDIISLNASNEEVTPTPTEKPEPLTSSGNKLLAYILEDNIWTIDENGENNTQLTENGANYSLSNLVWKDQDHLSYSRCSFEQDICQIVVLPAQKDSEVEIIVEKEKVEISTLGWTREGDKLFYHVFDRFRDEYKTFMFANEEESMIKDWPETVGRGLSIKDEVRFDFNNDSSKILLTNTLISPGEDYLTIFNSNGDEIETVDKNSTFGIFRDNKEYLYVSSSSLQSSDEEEPVIEPFKGLNPMISENGIGLIYWKYNDSDNEGLNNSYIYSLAELKERLLTKDFINPQWIDSDTIVGLTIEPHEGFYNYKVNGIGRVEKNGKGFISLLAAEVDEIAPQR